MQELPRKTGFRKTGLGPPWKGFYDLTPHPCNRRKPNRDGGKGMATKNVTTICTILRHFSEKVFVSQERVSGFAEKGADLRGSPANFR